jgi:hypothetical protein
VIVALLWFVIYFSFNPMTSLLEKKKMAQHTISPKRTKRSEAYENLLSSLDTENDLTFENSTNLEFDR